MELESDEQAADVRQFLSSLVEDGLVSLNGRTLALTEREILLIAEHEAEDRLRAGDGQTYGTVTTYLPLARFSRAILNHHDRFSILALEARGRHGGEKLEIILPPGDPGAAHFVEEVNSRKH